MIVLVCLEPPAPGRSSRAALDLACTLAGSARLLALTVGGPAGSESLELARSCAPLTRVLHIDAPELDQVDSMTTGMVLAEAARHLEAGLVIAGERSDREGHGLVPAALAHHLKATIVSRVQTVRFAQPADGAEVTTRAGGRLCTLVCPLPLVVTTAPDRVVPMARAAGTPHAVARLPLAQIGLEASRLVPRPDLLGELAPAPPASVDELTWEEAQAALLRHR